MRPEYHIFLSHFQETVLPQIAASRVAIIILSDHLDSKLCLEVGAAVLLDKPILVLTKSESLITKQISRLMEKAVLMPEDWQSEESQKLIQAALTEIIERLKA